MRRANRPQIKFAPVPMLVALVFAVGLTATIPAQEFNTNNSISDASLLEVPPVHALMRPLQTPRILRSRWLTLNRTSIAALVAGEAIDSWGTYRNMTHTKWICGNSPAFAPGYDTNVPSEISSLRDVHTVCGPGPIGQSANWAFDTTRAGYFSEGGWVTQFHLAGDRNYAGVEGWNIANDIGWYLFARRLGKRTDWIGKSGSVLNFARGSIHLRLGIENFTAVSHHQNPNTLDLHVPKDSNYNSARWWGKK